MKTVVRHEECYLKITGDNTYEIGKVNAAKLNVFFLS